MKIHVGRAVPFATAGLVAAALGMPGIATAAKGGHDAKLRAESRLSEGSDGTCAPQLVDSSGMVWDLESEGYVSDGYSTDDSVYDAYDDYGYAYVSPANDETDDHSYSNTAETCASEEDGREVVYPTQQNIGDLGVDLARKVYVPSQGKPFARWLDILSNPGDEPVTVNYEWYGDYGEISDVTASADGDTSVAAGERWASFNQEDESDVDQASLWDGPGSVLNRWDHTWNGYLTPGASDAENPEYPWKWDEADLVYPVTIPAHSRAIFMHIEHMNRTPEGARDFALTSDQGSAEFFAGMSSDELRDLRNWHADSDDDSVLDGDDNCQSVANADQADLDRDGRGDACDDDIDGDGLPNAIETAMGTNPRSTDSDGDGRPDNADSCPTLSGPGTGCPAAPVVVQAASTAGRALPTGVTLNVTASRGGGASASGLRAAASATTTTTVRSTGAINLPAGMSLAACAQGKVAVLIKRGTRTISTRIVDVDATCRYTSTVRFKRSVGSQVRVKAYFFGSRGLVGRAAKLKVAKVR